MFRRTRPSAITTIARIVVLCACAVAIPASPAVPLRRFQTPVEAQSFEASVVVRFLAGKTSYRLGEEIPLELEFRGNAGQDFYFSTENYDRSGRLRTEDYEVTPHDGFVDPLSDLFADGFVGGGARSEQSLDNKPFILHVSLNDWIRFTKSGAYRLVVTSGRLHRRSSQSAPKLTSEAIEFTITDSDDEWAASQTKLAAALIDGGNPPDVKHGAALLRYLDTEAAAMALLDRYDTVAKAGGWDIDAALVASSHRPFIVSVMEARIDAGGALDANFISTLTRLRLLAEIPPAAGNGRDRFDRRTAVQTEYETRWRNALARHPATAATLQAELARLQTGPSPDVQLQIAGDLSQNPSAAAEAFVALPPATQWTLLRMPTLWNNLNRPWILPALRRVYAQWKGGSEATPAGDLVLTRLYELANDEGRRLILDEIRTGDRQIGYDALAILPDAELPELDAAIESRYSNPRRNDSSANFRDSGTAAWLAARYGSLRLLPFVTDVLAERSPVCAAEGGFIAYLLRHDPAAAMKRLDPNTNRRGGCVAPLPAVVAHFWDDRVESAAIAQLEASNVVDVVDAAQVLGAHGSSAAKQPLLDRLVKWSAEWRGKAGELADRRNLYTSPIRIENFLVNALLQNRAFTWTPSEVFRIRNLCVTDQCRVNVDAQFPGNPIRIEIK